MRRSPIESETVPVTASPVEVNPILCVGEAAPSPVYHKYWPSVDTSPNEKKREVFAKKSYTLFDVRLLGIAPLARKPVDAVMPVPVIVEVAVNTPVTASPVEDHSLKIAVAAPPADVLIASVRTPGFE